MADKGTLALTPTESYDAMETRQYLRYGSETYFGLPCEDRGGERRKNNQLLAVNARTDRGTHDRTDKSRNLW
jgi:hypothetical protein